jgi:hypothetical protein
VYSKAATPATATTDDAASVADDAAPGVADAAAVADDDVGVYEDVLCETCGQMVAGNPLVRQGLVSAPLAKIFVPIIGKPVQHKKTRVITKARVLTGTHIILGNNSHASTLYIHL